MFKPLSILLVLLLSLHSPGGGEKDKHSGRFGGLVVRATAMAVAEGKNDRHYVAVFVNIKNTGKNPVCASFVAKLKTTYGLEYKQSWSDPGFPHEPRVREMLPGEESSGAYVFEVKNGVDTREMSLKLQGTSIRCGSAREGSWSDFLVTDEIRLDVHDLPAPKSDEQ